MTSPSSYTSTMEVDVGNFGKHLPGRDDAIENCVTSPERRPLVSSLLSPGQNHVILRISTSDEDDDRRGLIISGRESVASPGEYNGNCPGSDDQCDHQQQQPKVISRTCRAVSVPASVHRDLESRSLCEGEGHRRHFSTDVIKLNLIQPALCADDANTRQCKNRLEWPSMMTSSTSRDEDDLTVASSQDGGEAGVTPQCREFLQTRVDGNRLPRSSDQIQGHQRNGHDRGHDHCQGQGQGRSSSSEVANCDSDSMTTCSREKPQKPVKPNNLRSSVWSRDRTGSDVTLPQFGSSSRSRGLSNVFLPPKKSVSMSLSSSSPVSSSSSQPLYVNAASQQRRDGDERTCRQNSLHSDVKQPTQWTPTSIPSISQLFHVDLVSQPSDIGVESTCGQSSPRCNDEQRLQWTEPSRQVQLSDVSSSLSDRIEPPNISDLLPANVHIRRGEQLRLVANFTAYPPPDISWYRANDLLAPDDRISLQSDSSQASLTINHTESTDTGCYLVQLVNIHGTDRMYSSVTVEDRPWSPGQPAVTSITRRSVVLSWYGCGYDGGSTVTGYRIEKQQLQAGTPSTDDQYWQCVTDSCKHTTYFVRDLSPNTEYRFRVSAINRHGVGDPGPPSDVIVTLEKLHGPKLESRRESLERQQRQSYRSRKASYVEESPVMLNGPLSPPSLLAIRDEMPFEPRDVVVCRERNFADFYSVGEQIGSGKFGSVRLCTELCSGSTFATKFIRLRATQRDECLQEISVMNLLRHPKILLLWDAFESKRELILVMEHVGGRELLERIISDDYMLTERECVHFMRQICDAVCYMHSKHVLHLDLKPENILCVTPNGNEIKIIDFGLARKFDPSKTFKMMVGTPEFVAPEVINYDNISFATDMWSIGVITYILLSGLSPFAGDSDAETLVNVTAAEYDFKADEFKDVSETAKDFIQKLLIQQPKRRMTAELSLHHHWLSQDVTYMRAKRLSTTEHCKYLLRRKWQKTGRALQAINRLTCLQRQSVNSLHDGKSSQESSSGCGSVASGSLLDDVKTTEEPDVSDDKRKLSVAIDQRSNRDSGFYGSTSPYCQTWNDDDDAKHRILMQLDGEPTSNLLPQTSGEPCSLPEEPCETAEMESRLFTTDSVERSCDTQSPSSSNDVDSEDLQTLDTETPALTGNDESLTAVMNCKETASTVTIRTRSTSELTPTSTPDVSTSGSVGTGEILIATPDCETSVSEVSASTSEQSFFTPVITNSLRTSLTVTVSTPTRSFSTPEKWQQPSATSCVVSTRTASTMEELPSTSEDQTPQKTAPTVFVRTASSTPEKQEPPRHRVISPEFLRAKKNSPRPKKPPMFVRKMKNVSVAEGQTARFEVRVGGSPAPSVTWLKNGVELAIDGCKYSVESMVEEGRWSLLISDCTADDKAEYACTAVSNLGKITSRSQLVFKAT